MFVFLSKFLPLLVYPLGLAFVLLVFSLIVRKRAGLRNAAVILALVILWVCGTPWLPVSLARSLEWTYLPQADVPHAEVIVLLGGGTESPDYPRPTTEINGAGDRVLYAAQLYKEGKAEHILVSGGNLDFSDERGSTPAAEMEAILTSVGVPAEAIWVQPDSENTAEDAAFSAKMLNERGIGRILLVTSAMHMPRSVALFEKQGFEVIPAPTDYGVTQKRWEALFAPNLEAQLINLLPNTSNLGLTSSVMKEYLGMLVYHLRGWM